ncbi:MAG: nicotinate (nicotinamide) nucleotide adenylyltransferase [Candidatus Marinimicrobia bacterium]|nr:nicotinate (nicotinamide) nucleotide adenylyltransferase [Candidatus Neomarinimicrobiota bacterium]
MNQWGIFGGSFDPPHRGHIEMAILATDALPLAQLYLVPSFSAPLAKTPPAASAQHRLAMVALVANLRREWDVLSYEVDRQQQVATVDTVVYLLKQQPHTTPYLLLGADQMAQIHQWQRWEQLLDLVQVLCFERAGVVLPAALAARFRMMPFDSPISSTRVRSQVNQRESTADSLSPEVAEYIREHGLYR